MHHRTLPLIALAACMTPLALAETQSFSVEDFTAIDTRGGIDVIYTAGPNTALTVDQIDGDFSDLYLKNDGDTLIISRKSLRDKKGWFKNVSIKMRDDGKIVKVNGKRVPAYTVTVTSPALLSARVARSSNMTASGIDADVFNGKVSSSGDLTLSGNADAVTLKASSSGDLDASFLRARTLTIKASSSADVRGDATNGDVAIDAASSADVEVAAERAPIVTVSASSSADVKLTGVCGLIDVSASSSADVEAGKLLCTDTKAKASSGADISVFASISAIARASSGGDINIDGKPDQTDVSESSGGDVNL